MRGGSLGLGFVLSLGFAFGLRTGGPKNVQLLEGAVERTIEVALVTGQQGEALSAISHFLKDPSQAIFAGHLIELIVDIFSAAHQLIGEQAGFDGPDAAQAPAGDGHGLDQIHLDIAGGLKLPDVCIEQELKLFLGFGGKHDGLGGKAVAEAVAGRFR
jgi:hypothetical protein